LDGAFHTGAEAVWRDEDEFAVVHVLQ
jgi:hypothetical protein